MKDHRFGSSSGMYFSDSIGDIETVRAVTVGGPLKRPIAGSARFVFAVGLATLLPALAVAGKFYPDDPLRKEPPPLHVEDADFRKINDYLDLFQNMFGKPGERQPTKQEIRKARKSGQDIKPVPAQSANTLGEVPDSPWFTNRIGSRPMSVEDVLRGPGNENAPAREGPWEIVAAKTEGVTPGFRIRDSKGRQYFLKGGIHLLGPYATCCGRTSHSLPRADGTARDRLVRRSEAGGRTAVHAPVNAGD